MRPAAGFRELYTRIQTRTSTLSLAWIFHASFSLLLISQLALAVIFLRYGFEQYSKPSRDNLEKRTTAIRSAIRSSHGTLLLLDDQPSIPDKRRLGLTLLDDPFRMDRLPEAEWDEMPTCRRTYKIEKLDLLDICLGVLAPRKRWGLNFKVPGKRIYLAIVTQAPPLALTPKTRLLSHADRIEISFLLGGRIDRLAIVNRSPVSRQADPVTPTVYSLDNKSANIKPLAGAVCRLRYDPSAPPRTVYLCLLPYDQIPILAVSAKQWPPPQALRKQLIGRAAIFHADEGGRQSRPIAATYSLVNGRIVDKEGDALTSIDKLVRPLLDPGIEACLFDKQEHVVWRSGNFSCPGEQKKQKIARNAATSTLLAAVLFSKRDHWERPVPIAGTAGPSIQLRYNEQLAAATWLEKSYRQPLLIIALIFATGLVYSIVFRWVLQPIQRLSSAVEAASIDLSQRVVIPLNSSSDEIGILTRSFNNLLARVTDVVELEVNNLRMIGHDIRSPLQSLLAMPQSDNSFRQIKRIQNAIERFDATRGARDAFEQQEIGVVREDLAAFLNIVVENAALYGTFDGLAYNGPVSGTWVNADMACLEDVIWHILNNGARYRHPGTAIRILLHEDAGRALIDIENDGMRLEEGMEKEIFEYGVTTQDPSTSSLGQGLYAAKSFVTLMAGTIQAMNLPGGVRFRITFPLAVAE